MCCVQIGASFRATCCSARAKTRALSSGTRKAGQTTRPAPSTAMPTAASRPSSSTHRGSSSGPSGGTVFFLDLGLTLTNSFSSLFSPLFSSLSPSSRRQPLCPPSHGVCCHVASLGARDGHRMLTAAAYNPPGCPVVVLTSGWVVQACSGAGTPGSRPAQRSTVRVSLLSFPSSSFGFGVGGLVGWWVGWWVGWLVGWLVGWQVGWLVGIG